MGDNNIETSGIQKLYGVVVQNIERTVTPKKRMDALGLEPRTDRL